MIKAILASLFVWGAVAFAAMVAQAAQAAQAGVAVPKLVGSEWGPHSGSSQFIQFQTGGRIVGSGGCNRFFGSYVQTGAELKIGRLGATKMMCEQQVMAQENALFNVLSRVHGFQRQGHKLVLFDALGAEIAKFQQRDWD